MEQKPGGDADTPESDPARETAGTGAEPVREEPTDTSAAFAKSTESAAESRKRAKEPRQVPVKRTVNAVRTAVARVVWLVCVLAALALAIGALLIVLDANRDNSLVEFVLDAANVADLGVFDRDNGIKTFTGEDAETKNVLVNWGLGALAWLIVGRIVDRLIRP